jgi:hypothetical protein
MTARRALLVAPLVVALGGSAPASAADTVVAHLPRPSKIRTYGGVQVFSLFDGSAYRLAIRRNGAVEPLPVAPSRAPFDVDIGPDRHGRAQLVYTRCKVEVASEAGNVNRGCDLYVLSLAGGGERPVRGANTSANEFAPTLWKGSIAFARALKGRDRPVVYVIEPGSPRSRPAQRLPGVPRRARGQRATGGSVDELELQGNRLAQIVSFVAEGQVSDVRLVDTSDASTSRLARVGVGEGGQYFTGVGFADGYLAWAFSWVAGGGELVPGIYRDRLSTGELARADFPRLVNFQVVGLAPFAANGAYMIDADLPTDSGCGELPGTPTPMARECQLVRATPLRFRPIPG